MTGPALAGCAVFMFRLAAVMLHKGHNSAAT
jgi:hypothetical protein